MALSKDELEMLEDIDDPTILKGIIKTLDKAIDALGCDIGQVGSKLDKLENRIDNI